MTILADFLKSVRVGELQKFANLLVFPLLRAQFQEPGYLLLDEALGQGLLEVQEVSEAGSMNKVLVAQCLQSSGSFDADQGAIWEEVDCKRREMGAELPTRAVNEVYESQEEKLKEYSAAFSALAEQVGTAVFINGRFVYLDAFDSQAALSKLFRKMIESYVLDALEQTGGETEEPEKGAVEQLLAESAATEVVRYPSAGLGEDLHLKTEELVGSCLSLDGRVIHLALFAEADKKQRSRVAH